MDVNELKYWVAFTRIPRVGQVRFKHMLSHFGSLEKAWRAGASELGLAGLDTRTAQLVADRRSEIDPDVEMKRLEDSRIRAITWDDIDYPPRLKEIYDLPPVLYVQGDLLAEDERSVAMVGTRKAIAYGREVAHQLTYDIARSGVTIVSGLALGIDSIVHRAALEAGHRTIAVLGSGVDVIYPRQHASLADEIIRRSAHLGAPSWNAAQRPELPPPQPHNEWNDAGHCCRRGRRRQRGADHSGPRNRAGQGGFRRARQHFRPR